jgi:hypothetical protein
MKLTSAWKPAAVKKEGWDIDLDNHLKTTGQDGLSQAKVLKDCLQILSGKNVLEEAYLRGSFRAGWADHHSDVDFFAVVEPKNLEKAYDTVRDYLGKNYTVITGCHDRLVPEYGGIGFMFICKDQNSPHILQMDLYMAIKGVASKEPLEGVPRMFSKDPSYRWTNDPAAKTGIDHLPEDAKEFIGRFKGMGAPEDRMALLFDELMVTTHIVHKHMERGQTGRVLKDNNALIGTCAAMLETIIGWNLADSSHLYDANKVIGLCRAHGDYELSSAATRLETLITEPISKEKIHRIFNLAETIFEQGYPEAYAKILPRVELFKEHVSGYTPPQVAGAKLNGHNRSPAP